MARFSTPSYLSRSKIEEALQKFQRMLSANATVYDIGCANKPYASYFKNQNYVGVDTDSNSQADIKYTGASIPLPHNSADAIVCTETLQHSEDPVALMNEIYRLLKPGGTAFISVPFGIKMLATPYSSEQALQKNFSIQQIPTWRNDYWRFTKYGLLRLCNNFEVLSLQSTTGYIGTLLQLKNYGIASLGLGSVVKPYYMLTNSLGWLVDRLVFHLAGHTKFYDKIYLSYTSNYMAVIKKP